MWRQHHAVDSELDCGIPRRDLTVVVKVNVYIALDERRNRSVAGTHRIGLRWIDEESQGRNTVSEAHVSFENRFENRDSIAQRGDDRRQCNEQKLPTRQQIAKSKLARAIHSSCETLPDPPSSP